jgi:peptidoglycan/xylan/chitin deacetylase (PgdA/CDA1 family)
MYHSVAEYSHDPYQLTVTPATFERQLRWLRRRGLRGVCLTEMLAARAQGDRGVVGLTFDDGYADFTTAVVPALRRFGFTATVYVLAQRLGGSNEWDADAPRKPLMSAEQVRAVAVAGMEIGSHGLRHVHLPNLSHELLAHELDHSRTILRELSGQRVDGFAYPYGDAGEREIDAVRAAGYAHACHVGYPHSPTVHSIPRSFVGDRDRGARLAAKQVRHELHWRRYR